MRLIDIPIVATPKIDIQEFCMAIAAHITSVSPVIVTRSGEPVGYFIPVRKLTGAHPLKRDRAEGAFAHLLNDREMDEVIAEFEILRKQARANEKTRG